MTNSRDSGPPAGELDELLMTLADGVLTPAQQQRLMALLKDDPAARERYTDHLLLNCLLSWGQHPTVRELVGAPGATMVPVGDRDEASPGVAKARRVGSSVPWWRPWLPWTIAAATLLVGLAVVLWPRGHHEAPLAHRPPPSVAPAAVPDSLAIVFKLDAARWETTDGRTPVEGDVLRARHLLLRSGRATLALLNGVILTLEGPADLELVSIDRVFCHRGKIRMRVPGGAEGFVVSAPGSDVVDMGTEFALNIDADGKSRLMVFEGEVGSALLRADGSAQRNRNLKEHHALELDPGRFQFDDIEARPESYVTPLVLAIPPLELDPSYRDAVLAARPWGYWRFESMADGAVANEVGGRPPLRVTGPLGLAGTGNLSVAFEEGQAEKYLLMDGRWTPPREPGYAVELWFCTVRFGLAELAGLFVPRGESDYNPIFQLELTSQGRDWHLFRRVSVRFLHRWPPSLWGGDNLFFDHYALYSWHHVVSQVRDDRMELFVDGKALPPLSIRPERKTAACQLIVGQLKPLPRRPDRGESRPFVGRIDELALYDRPLSAVEVQRHYALGTPGGRPSVP